MRHYETLFIINPELPEEETNEVIAKFQGILTEGGSEMVKVDPWGRRRLAYAVKKHTKGFYVLFEYGAESPAVDEMERLFRIDERVIRFVTVKLGETFDAEAILAKAAQEKAKAEERAAAEAAGSDDDDDDDDYTEDDERE